MSGIALMLVLLGLLPDSLDSSIFPVAMMFLAWAATFGGLWLLRGNQTTERGKYPALVLEVVGAILLLVGISFSKRWPVILIAGGAILVRQYSRQRTGDRTIQL
jgi:hypothetical protein